MATRQTGSSYGHGVTYETWRARVKVEGEEVYLGSFPTEQEALDAEDKYRAGILRDPYYEPTEDAWFEWRGNRYYRAS